MVRTNLNEVAATGTVSHKYMSLITAIRIATAATPLGLRTNCHRLPG